MSNDIVEMTNKTLLMMDIYKLVKRRLVSPLKKVPSYDIANRVIFTGVGYALISLMDAAFAEFFNEHKERMPVICDILYDTCFCAFPLSDEEAAKKYGMDFSRYLEYKEEAIKKYAGIMYMHIQELEKTVYSA